MCVRVCEREREASYVTSGLFHIPSYIRLTNAICRVTINNINSILRVTRAVPLSWNPRILGSHSVELDDNRKNIVSRFVTSLRYEYDEHLLVCTAKTPLLFLKDGQSRYFESLVAMGECEECRFLNMRFSNFRKNAPLFPQSLAYPKTGKLSRLLINS